MAEGNVQAFELLYNMFRPKIHGIAQMLLKNTSDVDDVCQIIFMKMWLRREKFLEIKDLDGYMFMLAKNTIFDFLASQKLSYSDTSIMPENADEVTPQDKLEANDMQLLIDMVVENMPEQRRTIYRMSREEHLKNAEIATKLGLQKKTVENHLNLALKEIKKILRIVIITFFFWV